MCGKAISSDFIGFVRKISPFQGELKGHGTAVLGLALKAPVWRFEALADNGNGRTTTAFSEISWRPQSAARSLVSDCAGRCFANPPDRSTLAAIVRADTICCCG